jgi:hypothetical protein
MPARFAVLELRRRREESETISKPPEVEDFEAEKENWHTVPNFLTIDDQP